MRILFITLALVTLIGIGIYVGNRSTSPTKEEQQIIDALNKSLQSGGDRACLYVVPFPFSSIDARKSGLTCDRCDDLFESGLVTKDVREFESAGKIEFETRYELTDLGQSIFTPGDKEASAGAINGPRFCFGRTVFHKLVGSIQLSSDSTSDLAVTYVAKLENPHPFLFDARSKPLRLPVPSTDDLHLFPEDRLMGHVERNGTIMFYGTWKRGTD